MDVLGHVKFLADIPLYDKEKPFGVTLPADYEVPENTRLTNLEIDERLLKISDVRGSTRGFTLDTAGFSLLSHPTELENFEDTSDMKKYQRETENMLQKLLTAELVVCWDARLRMAERLHQTIEIVDLKESALTGSNPVNLVHTDETAAHGHESVEAVLSQEQRRRYLEGGYRVRMINTWRPLVDNLEHYPLALLDCRSMDTAHDLVAYDQVTPLKHKELYLVKAQDYHQWFWVSRQMKTELLLFVEYDNNPEAFTRACPHAGFQNTNAPHDAELRRSIETRSIVVTKMQPG